MNKSENWLLELSVDEYRGAPANSTNCPASDWGHLGAGRTRQTQSRFLQLVLELHERPQTWLEQYCLAEHRLLAYKIKSGKKKIRWLFQVTTFSSDLLQWFVNDWYNLSWVFYLLFQSPWLKISLTSKSSFFFFFFLKMWVFYWSFAISFGFQVFSFILIKIQLKEAQGIKGIYQPK